MIDINFTQFGAIN